jgi:hypothetical protein
VIGSSSTAGAEIKARDPEGWARAHAWAKGVMEQINRDRPEPTTDPDAEVRLAIDVIGQWRQVRRDESRRESERVRRLIDEKHSPRRTEPPAVEPGPTAPVDVRDKPEQM